MLLIGDTSTDLTSVMFEHRVLGSRVVVSISDVDQQYVSSSHMDPIRRSFEFAYIIRFTTTQRYEPIEVIRNLKQPLEASDHTHYEANDQIGLEQFWALTV